MTWISFGAFQGIKKLDDSSRLDVVEISRIPDMLPSLFPSRLGQGLICAPLGLNERSVTNRQSHDVALLN